MHRLLPLLIAALTLSVLHTACPAEGARETRPRFKGVELYSWQDHAGDWMFALLEGTNRNKTAAEVKAAPNKLKGAEAIKKALARLAVGEQVFWNERVAGFKLPPADMKEDIEKAAREAKVELH